MNRTTDIEWAMREIVDVTPIGPMSVLIARTIRPGAIVTDVSEEGDFTVNGVAVHLPSATIEKLCAVADQVLVGSPDSRYGYAVRVNAAECERD